MSKPSTPGAQLFATLLASKSQKRTRSEMIALSASLFAHVLAIGCAVWLTHGTKTRIMGADPSAFTLLLNESEIKPLHRITRTRSNPQPVQRPHRRSAARKQSPVAAPTAPPQPAAPNIAEIEPRLETKLATASLDAMASELSRAGQALADRLVGDSVGDAEPSLEELEAGGPVYTPYSAGALLLNRDEIADILRDRYPFRMRQQRLGGLTTLWLLIDKSGNPRKAVLHESSGYEVFDSLAIDVVPLMRFSPAVNNGTPRNVWVQLPIRFRVVDD